MAGLNRGWSLGATIVLFLLTGIVPGAMPQSVLAATYSVCPLPAVCDYQSPDVAVNDPVIVDGDTIDVVTDTYVLGATLQVDKSITILANNSVFDANGTVQAINVSGAATNLSLTHVTIQNGQAGAGFGGGALRVSGGAIVTVINGTFENNQAEFGGAIHNIGSTISLRESTVFGNRATNGQGGAILTQNGGVTNLTRTEIDGNQASVEGGGLAVYDSNSQLNLIASTVSNNVALVPIQTVSNPLLSGTTLSCGPAALGQTFVATASALSSFEFSVRLNGGANVIPNDLNIPGQVRAGGPAGPVIATASAFAPGGTWPGGSTQTLTFILDQPVALVAGATYTIESAIAGAYSLFISPGDDYAGGSFYNCDGTLIPSWDLYFRTFGGTPGQGGGIYSSSQGSTGLFNSTVSGNVGDGASAAFGGFVTTLFSTISNNSGNGLTALSNPPAGLVFITASIVAGNGGDDCNGDATTSGYNLIGDDNNCVYAPTTGDIFGIPGAPLDPLLGPLQDNGGWTPTHALDPNSPALDGAGSTLALPCTDAPEDQRGVTRPGAAACDIGAFERAGPLQTLINLAVPGAIIDVPNGTYSERISLGDGTTLRGSGPGSVVIDATGLGGPAITATGDFTLENIRVTGGNSAADGGGVFSNVAAAEIILNNVVFDNNNAALNGGAIYLSDGTLTASNVTFTNNNAVLSGGAISTTSSDISVVNGTFDANTAGDELNAIAGDGGAVILNGGAGVIDTSVFTGNQAFGGDGVAGRGGAVFNDANLSITDTTIDTSDAGIGGGIYNSAISELGGSLDVAGSTFSNNTAHYYATAGGAIGGAGEMVMRNSTFSGNAADAGNGGGIGLTGGVAQLNNVTLAFNSASSGLGAAFYAESGEPGALISLSNSLLSGNSGGNTNCSTFTSLGYNLFQTAPCATAPGDMTGEPLISLLASNGGPTRTHALQALSPAVNAGHPVPNFPQFNAGNFPLLQTQGAASLDTDKLLLAGSSGPVGSAFVSNPIDPGQDFSANFQFQIFAGDSGAADGITFTISDDPTVLGSSGGFLGIGIPDPIEPSPAVRGVVNGVSVEFDTWVNGQAEGANDPGSVDHIGIDINGSLSSVALSVLGPHGTLSDGSIWSAWIDYDATTKVLEVRASNNGSRPVSPTVSSVVDIASLTGPVAYAGFTGSGGFPGISGEHRIVSFSFADSCEAVDQRGDLRPQGAGCDIGAFEGAAIPLQLGSVVLSTHSPGQDLGDGTSYPGVVDVPIIDIPIEKLTGDTFNAPASAPLGSFPLGSFPLGSFDLQNSPLGSFPLGSFPIGSFPLGSFPLGSFPLSSIPLLSAGGWTGILDSIPELAGAPLQTVTLEQLLRLNPLPNSVAGIALRDLSIEGSPLASLSLPGLSLGDTTVEKLDEWAQNADPGATPVCATLLAEDPSFTRCTGEDTLMGLEVAGAPVSALSLAALPLGSFRVGTAPIGSFPLASFPIGSFPLGSFPLGSFPLGSFPLGSFPIGSFPLGSFPLGSFPLGSFNLLAAPTSTLPLGSFPLGSFPLGSFAINGKSFCEFYDEQAVAEGADTCADLQINPGTDSLADLVEALQATNPSGSIGSTPLGSFPMGSFPIGSFPIGSFGLDGLNNPPLSLLKMADFGGCQEIDGTATCSTIASLSETSSLLDVATHYGSLAASPLGSFPIGSFGISDLPMGSFPLGSFDVNGAPLGSFPLGSFDLLGSPLGSFPVGSFAAIIDNTTGPCDDCRNLADAVEAGVVSATTTLADLKAAAPAQFAALTFGQVLDALTLAMLYGPPGTPDNPNTLADIEDTGNLTLGQLLIAMMLKTDFPWETITLAQLDPQEFSADNFVNYVVDIPLTGSESEPFVVAVTLADSFLYVKGSASLGVETPLAILPSVPLGDPVIVDNGDGTQTLSFDLILGGFSDNTVKFSAVPAMALGDYPAAATVKLGAETPVPADNSNGMVSIIPDPITDVSDSDLALTAPVDELLLGFINTRDDNDFYRVAPPAAGDRVSVFMSNPAGDNDLIMYEPLSTVEAKGQAAEAAALDSVPFEDDGVDYQGNTTEEPNALEDVNLAPLPLSSISTNRGGEDEAVSAIAGNTEPFTIQVSGYNGAVSEQPYTLRVKLTPRVPAPQCTARSWPADWPVSGASPVVPAGSWMPDTNAVFLVNPTRLAASEGGDAAAADAANAALTSINQLINAPGITQGVVVDVSGIAGVDYTDWDANPCDVDAANAIVNAITHYLEEQRLLSPNLSYVTIVGSDEVIPFARKPDETSISNESTFAGEFSDNAMFGALVTRHFLSDDTYGDIDPIPWLDRYLNVPELGVGRLVESAADIQTAAENYIAFSGVLDPQTALSAGYDFIADAAQNIDGTFNAYSPALGFAVEPALIDQPGVDPLNAWTRPDFLLATGLNSPAPVDLVSFNMHFNFSEALPSSGDAAGNYTDNLISTTDLGNTDLAGGIWFTVGCHSGSNLADVSVIGSAPGNDWAQTFSHLGAVFLAQNAFGLGDTEAIALTERLLALFARNLNGSMSIGQAHAFAKQQYFADLGLYGEYDFKALQAATLFGLPMYQYGHGAMVTEPLPPVLPVATDPISGLVSASWSLADTGISKTNTGKGELFSVDGEVQFVHFRPLQPIVRRDVTGPNGETAGGAFLTGLTTEDKLVTDIAFARPVIALAEIEPEIETDEVVFPTAFTNISSFKAPPPGGGPFASRQQLNVIVGQYTSPLDKKNHGTERLFRSFDTQVFYRQTAPAPLMLASATEDYLRPEFDNVQASIVGSTGARQAVFSVDVFDEGTVLRVAVLYLQSVSGNPVRGNWVLADLVRGAGGNTWTGGGPVDLSGIANGQVDYMVQAVDDNGNVANSTFKGLFYVAEEIPTAPDSGGGAGTIGVIVRVDGNAVDPGDWISTDPVDIEVTDQAPDTRYEYSVDFESFIPLTASGFQISGDGVHIVTVRATDGSNPVTFVVLIDTTPPQAVIATPATGQYVVQGQEPVSDFDCLDAGSGITSCIGTVPDGAPVPSATTGRRSFVVTAQDDAQLGPTVAENVYTVVQSLQLAVPVDMISVGQLATVAGSATDIDSVVETATIDWGDGTTEVLVLNPVATAEYQFNPNHEYLVAGTYEITVSVDFGGEFLQRESISITILEPVGIWAQGDEEKAVEWSGGKSSINGLLHSNGGIKIDGSKHTVNGITRYVKKLKGAKKVKFSTKPTKVDTAVWPFTMALADYQPGGRAALAAGVQYFDMSAVCTDEEEDDKSKDKGKGKDHAWEPNDLVSGLYWVPCDVKLKKSHMVGDVTIISTGIIELSAKDMALNAFIGNLLLSTSSTDHHAIKLKGTKSMLKGFLLAEHGGIEVSGSDINIGCGLAANEVELTGSKHEIGADCGR